MAIKTNTMKDVFHSGRGGPQSLAKSDSEVIHEESEIMEEIFPSQEGDKANDSGAKPIFMTGDTSFHHGRGEGRGHGLETPKDA